MPYLHCATCNSVMEINIGDRNCWNIPDDKANPRKIIGSATCKNCGMGTGFEIFQNVINYVSGKSTYGELNANVPEEVKMLYSEAELCFQNGVPNASTAMCRAATELALNKARFEGKVLFDLIQDAGAKGKLDTIEVGLAHSSRLVTRDAIHRGEFVSLKDVPSILSATIRVLNKIAS